MLPWGAKVGVLGRNGAGKTTLLGMISGTVPPTAGEIRRSGSISWPLGFSGSFHPDLTGAQNVRFVARIYGMDTEAMIDFVDDFAELGEFMDMPLRSYSSGMQARLAFGMSMGVAFDWYLVDEITAVGDTALPQKSLAPSRPGSPRRGILFTSHSPATIRSYCTSGLVIERGQARYYPDSRRRSPSTRHRCSSRLIVIPLAFGGREGSMARRRIGQEVFGFAAGGGRNAGLDELGRSIDWGALDALLKEIYAAGKGEPAWPPLALFKALLLGVWHDLSDVRLAEALDDRASFRRFCGFASSEATPERTAFVRFRRELVARRLDGKLFAAVVRQLEGKGLVVKTGTLIDATVIGAASKDDGEAAWNAYAGRPAVKGYKAHVSTDEAGGIVRKVVVTPANVHDSQGLVPVLPRHPGRVYADAAYDSADLRERIRARGGRPHIVRRIHKRSRPALNAAKAAWNATIRPVRCRIEKVFGTTKRSYGLRRARYLGLAKVTLQV